MLGAFAASRYSLDDVEAAMNGLSFLTNMADAKEYVGLKVINGREDILSDVGVTPYNFDAHECMSAFRRSGYSETDARAALMAFDFLSSVGDAKEYIGLKIQNGTENILKNVGITRSEFDGPEMLAAFANSSYDSADVRRAVKSFDFLSDAADAREYIGLKVMNGTEYILEEAGITPDYASNPYDFKSGKGGAWNKGAMDAKGYGAKGGVGFTNAWDYK